MKNKIYTLLRRPRPRGFFIWKTRHSKSIDLGLSASRGSARSISSPAPACFTVAGTNGKKMTRRTLESALIAAGYRGRL